MTIEEKAVVVTRERERGGCQKMLVEEGGKVDR